MEDLCVGIGINCGRRRVGIGGDANDDRNGVVIFNGFACQRVELFK